MVQETLIDRFDSPREGVYEDELLDDKLVDLVGLLHFYSPYLGKDFSVKAILRHQRIDGLEVDAVVKYETHNGYARYVGFELKLGTTTYAFGKAVEQALLRRPHFHYFYVVYGGRLNSYISFEAHRDGIDLLLKNGIGLVVRPYDVINHKLAGDPVFLIRSRLGRGKGGSEGGALEP